MRAFAVFTEKYVRPQGCSRKLEKYYSFRLVLEGKTGKEISESSRLEFLEKFSANNFALSDAKDINSGPLNRGGIVDLPLFRTLLAIRQKSREPGFWKVKNSFALLAYASLAALRIHLQQLLACLNFISESDLFWYKRKNNDFYGLWQQHKQLKTIEMSEG